MSKLEKVEREIVIFGEPPTSGRPAYCSKTIVGYERAKPAASTMLFASGSTNRGNSSGGVSFSESFTGNHGGAGGNDDGGYSQPGVSRSPPSSTPRNSGSGGIGASAYTTVPIYSTTCYPAIPPYAGTPDQFIKTPGDSWHAGARSYSQVSVHRNLVATVPANYVGVIIGLVGGGVDHSDGYKFDHATLGVAFTLGKGAQVIVSGAVAKQTQISGKKTDYVVEFRRGEHGIDVVIDDEDIFHLPMGAGPPLYGMASLYTATDFIRSADILPTIREAEGSFSVPAPSLRGSDIPDYNLLEVPAPILDGSGTYSIGWNYGRLRMSAPALSGASAPYVPPTISYGGGSLIGPTIAISGQGEQGRLARGTLGMRIQTIGADSAEYNFGALRTPISIYMNALSSDITPGVLPYPRQYIAALDEFALTAPVMIAFAERLRVGETVDFVLVFGLDFDERLGIEGSGNLFANESISFAEAIRFSDASTMGRAALTYAVDLVTGALREYSDYGFTHYMNLGTELWAARPDGIYQLSSRSEAAQALLDLGVLDFGAGQQKRIATSWVGVRTDGQVYLRVTVDGREYVYRAVPHGGDVQRIGIGKGLSARHWKMRLEIEDATFASIDSVEFELGVSQRRKDGRRRS